MHYDAQIHKHQTRTLFNPSVMGFNFQLIFTTEGL